MREETVFLSRALIPQSESLGLGASPQKWTIVPPNVSR